MDNLTEKQQETLKSFRYSVVDILQPEHDNHFLLQFLQARNFNEEKAEGMLRKSLRWRKQMRVHNFLDHYKVPEVLSKYHPGGFLGYDKEGCPIWLLRSGRMDIKGFMESVTRSEFLKYQTWRFETLAKHMKEQSKKLNRRIGKNVYIMDEKNLPVSQILNKPVLETLLGTLSLFEANYPETLKRCYVINVPKPFFLLFSLIKPMLSEETANKVKIFGTEGWKEALLEDVDTSVLPVYWGGTRVDQVTGDPECSSTVNRGGIIPEKHYLSKQTRLAEEAGIPTVVVPKRDHVDIAVKVSHPKSIVHWEVETLENDLAIGFYYSRSDGAEGLEELAPCTRAETFRAAEHGSYECDGIGKYVVRLDNSFSWFSAKKATYRIYVTPPRDPDVTEST